MICSQLSRWTCSVPFIKKNHESFWPYSRPNSNPKCPHLYKTTEVFPHLCLQIKEDLDLLGGISVHWLHFHGPRSAGTELRDKVTISPRVYMYLAEKSVMPYWNTSCISKFWTLTFMHCIVIGLIILIIPLDPATARRGWLVLLSYVHAQV